MSQDQYSFTGTSDPESDLAYFLQNSAPGDPHVLDLLLSRYAAELYRLACALEDSRDSAASPKERALQAQTTVSSVLAKAVRQLNQFWGQAGVQEWLVRLLLQETFTRRQLSRIRKGFKSPPPTLLEQSSLQTSPARSLLEAWEALPAAPQLALLLRYSHKLSIHQIALILEVKSSAVHTALVQARLALLSTAGTESLEECIGWEHNQDSPDALIQRRLDGLLDQDPYAAAALRSHLEECAACRQEWQAWAKLERRLADRFQTSFPGMTADQRRSLAEQAHSQLQSAPRRKTAIPWRYLSAAGLLIVALIAVLGVFTNFGQDIILPEYVDESPQTATQPPRRGYKDYQQLPLPTPIPLSAEFNPQQSGVRSNQQAIFSGEPSFSADGRFLVFSSSADYWVEGDTNQSTDVFLADLEQNQIERISIAPDGSEVEESSFSPVISADGRYIAYLTTAGNLLPDSGSVYRSCGSYTVDGGTARTCQDILVFDRETGVTTRVTRPVQGGTLLNSIYTAPVISADGRFVLFYSTQQVLEGVVEDGQPSNCPDEQSQLDQGEICFNLYVYDQNTGDIQRIPIGRRGIDMFTDPILHYPPSISADGRTIALTLSVEDGIAAQLGILEFAKAFVYDTLTDTYQALETSEGFPGLPGNNSYSPVISADGRSVVYSIDCAAGGVEDGSCVRQVVVRDLTNFVRERMSFILNGELPSGDSGGLAHGAHSTAPQLAISGDGRYVAFYSQADNLDPQAAEDPACWQGQEETICGGMYLRDRQTGETRLIAPVRAPFAPVEPALSTDGTHFAYAEQRLICPGGEPYQICSDIWIGDLASGVMQSLSRRWAQVVSDEALSTQIINALDADLPQKAVLVELPALHEHVEAFSNVHRFRLTSLDISPDGSLLVSGGGDERVRIWDTASMTVLNELSNFDYDISVARFSSDGEWLGAAALDGVIRVWRVADLIEDAPQQTFSQLRSATIGSIYDMDFSPDGRWLAVASGYGLWFWERSEDTYRLSTEISIPGLKINAVEFVAEDSHPNTALLAAALSDGTVLVSRLPRPGVITRLSGHTEAVLSLAFDSSGSLLATGGNDGYINIWRLNRSMPSLKPEVISRTKQSDWVTSLQFSENSKILVSGGYDDYLRYIEVSSGQMLDEVSNSEWGDLISIRLGSEDARLFAGSSNGSLVVFSAAIVEDSRFFETLDPGDEALVSAEAEKPFYESALLPPIALNGEEINQLIMLQNLSFESVTEEIVQQLVVPTQLQETSTLAAVFVHQATPELATIYYYLDEAEGGLVVLRQGPLTDPLMYSMHIPEDIPVVSIPFSFLPALDTEGTSQLQGELVRGGWDLEGVPGSDLIWNLDIPQLHLRWAAGDQGYDLSYMGFGSRFRPEFQAADLIEIASSMRRYVDAAEPKRVGVPYIAKTGDTCTSVSLAYGTEVMGLVRFNRGYGLDLLVNGCEILDPGMEIFVPVTSQPYITADLNCDSRPERLQMLPYPDGGYFGFILQVLGSDGFYRNHTKVRFQDNTQQSMRLPKLHKLPGTCEWLVSVQVDSLEATGLPNLLPLPILRIFRWDGERFATVLDTKGELIAFGLEEDSTLPQLITRGNIFLEAEQACGMQEKLFTWQAETGNFEPSSSPAAISPVECDAPPAGDLLEVEQVYFTADLNCDQAEERLVAPLLSDGTYLQRDGLQVQSYQGDGKYVPRAAYTAADAGGAWTGFPRVYSPQTYSTSSRTSGISCWDLIAMPVYNQEQDQIYLDLLNWDGQVFNLLLRVNGELNSINYGGSMLVSIYARESRRNADGICQPQYVEYTWNGQEFDSIYQDDDSTDPCP